MSKSNVQLGALIAAPGEVKEGYFVTGNGEFSIPAAIINGRKEGKTVLITAGIHAAEYVGIQATAELARELDPEKLSGQVILIKTVCTQEFENRLGGICATDQKNLNRVFPGAEQGTKTERLAYAIVKELQSMADYYIDLHGGDEYEQLTPFVYYAGKAEEDVVTVSRKMAQQVDVPYMVRSAVSSGGAYNYAASCGIPSILLERGQMGGWKPEEVQSMKRDIRNVLCYLGIYEGLREFSEHYPLDVENIRYEFATEEGLWYPEKRAGDLITKGDVLGYVRDYCGRVKETSIAECSGVILFQTGSLAITKEGSMIAYGEIVSKADDRKERITSYWTKRSEDFLELKRKELHDPISERWLAEFAAHLPSGRKMKVLDVGCGTGYFSILLAKEGHQVTGVDLTPDMIACAKQLSEEEKTDCAFYIMDAENLDFESDSFDLVVSRNLTWTLPEADKAYEEWHRVLKPGGILLNVDANYGLEDFTDKKGLPENHAHNAIEDAMMEECEAIKRQLPISSYSRPAWDMECLAKVGMEEFEIDLGISKRLYPVKDDFYNPAPLFLICAKKAGSQIL